jgi:hypothetical protein
MPVLIINVRYNYTFANKDLLEECEKEENVAVTGGYYHFLFQKNIVKRFVQCHILAQSPPGMRPSDKCPVNTSHPLPGL